MIKATQGSQIIHEWHLVDAKGQTLGRLATKLATLLMGKAKTYYVRNLDCGDNLVIINAKDVAVTGKKETTKVYTRYSGYPGGGSRMTLGKKRELNSANIIELAVKGMIPNNKLRDRLMTRLHVYKDDIHPYNDKFKS